MTGPALPVGRLPRDLHPIAWWSWAIGLATAASFTTNPLLLLLIMGSATVVVMARRSGHPFGRSFRLYAMLAAFTVVVRVVFRIIFGGQEVGHVLLDLPEIPLPDWAAGIRLLGPVTSEAVLAGLYDGLRLAAIILCVGAANSLANPKRLLASVPPRRCAAAPRRASGGCAASSCPSSRTRSNGRCRSPPGWTPAATAAPAARPSGSGG